MKPVPIFHRVFLKVLLNHFLNLQRLVPIGLHLFFTELLKRDLQIVFRIVEEVVGLLKLLVHVLVRVGLHMGADFVELLVGGVVALVQHLAVC